MQSFREKDGASLKPREEVARSALGTEGWATETGEGKKETGEGKKETGEGALKENRVWGGGDGDGSS